jgi:hypothetical protein
MALGQSCLVASNRTTKEVLAGGTPHISTANSRERAARLAAVVCSRAPAPHVDFRADVAALRDIVRGIERDAFVRAEAAQAAANAAWAAANGRGGGSGGQALPAQPTEPVPAATVVVVAGEAAAEAGASAVPKAQPVATVSPATSDFMAAHYPAVSAHASAAAAAAGGALTVRTPAFPQPAVPPAAAAAPVFGPPDARPACRDALMHTVDSAMFDDAVAVSRATASAAPVRGVVTGLDFLPLPSMSWPPDAAAAAPIEAVTDASVAASADA